EDCQRGRLRGSTRKSKATSTGTPNATSSRRRPFIVSSEPLTGEQFVRLHVARPGVVDDRRRQRRRSRTGGLVPVALRGGEPVAHDLLVVGRLCPTGLPLRRRPEPTRVRGEHLVGENDRAVRTRAELELRV